MALNRFSSLPKATIQNTQVLTDLGVIDSSFQRRQKNYDETAQAANVFQSKVSGLQGYGDAAKNYLAKVDEDVKGAIGELSSTDLGSPEARNKLAGLVNTISSDKNIQSIQKANELRAEHEKNLQELNSKGKLHMNQLKLQEEGWDKYSKSGDIRDIPKEGLYEAQDLVEGRRNLVKDIEASGHEGTSFLNGIAYGSSSKGVSYDRVSNSIKAQLSTYANSQYGRQEKVDFVVGQKEGSIPKNMKFEDYLLKQVMSTAQNKVHSFTSNDYSSAFNKDRDEKKKKEEDTYVGEGYTPAMKSREDIELDSDGNININPALDIWDSITGSNSRTPEQLALQKVVHEGAKKAGIEPKAFAERLNADANINVKYFTTKKSKEVSERFFNSKTGGGDLSTRMIYSPKFPQGIAAKDFFKEQGLTEAEAKNGITIVGDVDADNPYTPKGYYSMINGEPIVIDDSYSNKLDSKEGQLAQFNFLKAQAKHNGTGLTKFKLGGVEFEYSFDGQNLVQESAEPIKKN